MCVCFFSLSSAVTTAFLVWRQSCCWRKRVREETCSCGLGATETPMLSPQDRRITMGNYTHTQGPMYTVTINGSAYLNMETSDSGTLDSGLLGHFGFYMFFFYTGLAFLLILTFLDVLSPSLSVSFSAVFKHYRLNRKENGGFDIALENPVSVNEVQTHTVRKSTCYAV